MNPVKQTVPPFKYSELSMDNKITSLPAGVDETKDIEVLWMEHPLNRSQNCKY